jgi:hypothetical protein
MAFVSSRRHSLPDIRDTGHSLNQEAVSDNPGCDTVFGCFYPEFPFQMVMLHANFPKVTWVIHICQKRRGNPSIPVRRF